MMAELNHFIRNPKMTLTPHVFVSLLTLFLLVGAGVANAQEDIIVFTPEEKAWLMAHPVIRIAPNPNFPPFEFFDDEGKYTGYTSDYVRRISELTGLKIEILRFKDQSEVIQNVANGKVDVLPFTIKNKNIEGAMVYSNPFYLASEVIIVNEQIKGAVTWEKLRGKKVAAVASFVEYDFIKKHHPEVQAVAVDSTKDGIRKLSAHKVDALLTSLGPASYMISKYGITNTRIGGVTGVATDAGFGIRKDWPELTGIINKVLDSMDEEEKSAIYRKWIILSAPEKKTRIELTGVERTWLAGHPVVRVVMDPYWAPVEFRDDEGSFQGISMDYLKRLEELLGIRLEVTEGLTWEEGVTEMRAKRLDMVTAMARTEERETFSLFTEPFLSMPVNIFARNDISYIGGPENLTGKRVAVVKATPCLIG